MLARALVRRFPLFGYRDFVLLLADRLLAPAAFAFSLVGVSFAVLDATGSTADLSYVLAAQIAPSLVFALVGGVVADRLPAQWVIIAGNVMIALGEGTFGILDLAGHPRLWQMVVLEALTGTGMAIFYPASQALLPRLVPGDLLQQASAISRLATNAAQMGGAVVAGLCVAAFGPGWALARVRRRLADLGADAAEHPGDRDTPGPRKPACFATCGTAGRSSARTPGCGRSRCSSGSS